MDKVQRYQIGSETLLSLLAQAGSSARVTLGGSSIKREYDRTSFEYGVRSPKFSPEGVLLLKDESVGVFVLKGSQPLEEVQEGVTYDFQRRAVGRTEDIPKTEVRYGKGQVNFVTGTPAPTLKYGGGTKIYIHGFFPGIPQRKDCFTIEELILGL